MAITKFNVVLDMPITAKQKATINKDIQALVKKHVAAIDNEGALLGSKRIPKEWLGIWLKKFKTAEAIKASVTFAGLKR
jgi:hypothetical protein